MEHNKDSIAPPKPTAKKVLTSTVKLAPPVREQHDFSEEQVDSIQEGQLVQLYGLALVFVFRYALDALFFCRLDTKRRGPSAERKRNGCLFYLDTKRRASTDK